MFHLNLDGSFIEKIALGKAALYNRKIERRKNGQAGYLFSLPVVCFECATTSV